MSERVRVPAKTDRVLATLKQCAKDMRTITYQELADATGLFPPGVNRPLGYIRDEVCRKHQRPWLNAIAVSKQTMRPSGGFAPEGIQLDPENDHWSRGMVTQVYAYDWSEIEIEEQ